jgi:biopolymer transport protein ExbB/TolQ
VDAFAWGIVGSVAGVVGAAAALVFGLVPLIRGRREIDLWSEAESEPPETLDERLDKLSASFRESARLVEQVSAELDARAVTARQLEQRAQDARALAAQHTEQVDAMRRLLRSEMKAELTSAERHIFRDSLKVAIASFVLGAAASVLITLLVHPV